MAPLHHNILPAWCALAERLDPEIVRPLLEVYEHGRWTDLQFSPRTPLRLLPTEDGVVLYLRFNAYWFCDLHGRKTGSTFRTAVISLHGTPDAWDLVKVEPLQPSLDRLA